MPDASGPLARIASVMLDRAATDASRPVLTSPQIPHILLLELLLIAGEQPFERAGVPERAATAPRAGRVRHRLIPSHSRSGRGWSAPPASRIRDRMARTRRQARHRFS